MPSKENPQDTKQAISCLQTLLAIIAVIVGAIAIGFLVTSLELQDAENGLWILFGIGLVFFMLMNVVIKRKQKKSQDPSSKQNDIQKNDIILPDTDSVYLQSDKMEKSYCESSNKLQVLPSVGGQEITEKEKSDEKINHINTNYQIPYQIDAEHVQCTCPDWIERRSKEPEHSPFRVCEHLASYYTNHYSRIPKKLYPYRMLIVSFSRKNRLLPYGGEGNNTLIDEDGIGIITQIDESPMVTVYRNDKEYKYDPKTNRWEYGNIPPNSPQITKSIPLKAAQTPIMNFTSEEGIPFQSFSSPAMYTIYPERAECTCPDWVESRSNEPLESPCRVCKHLAYYYSQHFSSLPKELAPFLRLIVIRGAHKRGLPYGAGLTFPYMGGDRPALIEFSTGSPWVSIYIDSLRYGFNFEENRWAYGEMPSKAAKISTFIHHQLGIVGSSQALTIANCGYAFEDSIQAISEPITWEKNVLPMLEDALGDKLPHEVEWVERKGYFVIYRGKTSNWICRVYYGANYMKYVMLKDKSTLHMKSGERLYKRDCPKLKEAFQTKS